MTTWKSVERKVAALLGGVRVPVTGRFRGSAPDVAHDFFSIEVKHRDKLPEWIAEAMEQAEASNVTALKIPLVVLHEKGQKFTDSYAVLKLGDLIALKERLDFLQIQINLLEVK